MSPTSDPPENFPLADLRSSAQRLDSTADLNVGDVLVFVTHIGGYTTDHLLPVFIYEGGCGVRSVTDGNEHVIDLNMFEMWRLRR